MWYVSVQLIVFVCIETITNLNLKTYENLTPNAYQDDLTSTMPWNQAAGLPSLL